MTDHIGSLGSGLNENVVGRFQFHLRSSGKSPATRKLYLGIARRYVASLTRTIEESEVIDVERFLTGIAERYGDGEDPRSALASYYAAIVSLYRALELPLASVLADKRRRPRPPPHKPPRVVSPADVVRLVDAAKGDFRLYAMVQIFVFGGLRVSEVAHLLPDDVRAKEGLLYVRMGKGDKDRMVHVPPNVLDAIRIWQLERALLPTTPETLFGISDNRIEDLLGALGERLDPPLKVTPHMLRHSYATAVLSRGVDVRYIQLQLGHSSIATTQIYLNVSGVELRSRIQSVAGDLYETYPDADSRKNQ